MKDKQDLDKKDKAIIILGIFILILLILFIQSFHSDIQTKKAIELNETIRNATIYGYNQGIYDCFVMNTNFLYNQGKINYFIKLEDGNLSLKDLTLEDLYK